MCCVFSANLLTFIFIHILLLGYDGYDDDYDDADDVLDKNFYVFTVCGGKFKVKYIMSENFHNGTHSIKLYQHDYALVFLLLMKHFSP